MLGDELGRGITDDGVSPVTIVSLTADWAMGMRPLAYASWGDWLDSFESKAFLAMPVMI